MSPDDDGRDWRGEWPVMLTPMHEDHSVDVRGLEALTDWHVEEGAAGLFACCLSSEAFDLTEAEKLCIAQVALRRAAGRVPVVVGVLGQRDTAARRDAAMTLADLGADAVILDAAEFAQREESDPAVCDHLLDFAASLPGVRFGVYECPRPYHRLLTPETTATLARSGRFTWIKETSCRLDALERKLAATRGSPLAVFNAHTAYIRDAVNLGCAGHSGVVANLSTALCALACDPAFDPAHAAACVALLEQADATAFDHGYPASAKYALSLRGLPLTPVCRVPTPRFTQASAAVLRKLVDTILSAERNWRSHPAPSTP